MRIALVSPYSWTYPGGVTRHIEALAEQLLAAGHDVRVLAPFDPPDARSARLHRGARPQDAGAPGLRHPARPHGRDPGQRRGLEPRRSRRPACSALRRELEAGDFDVVHVHEPVAPSVGWDALAFGGAAARRHLPHLRHERRHARRRARDRARGAGCNHLHGRIAVSEAAAWTARRFFGGRYRRRPQRRRRSRRSPPPVSAGAAGRCGSRSSARRSSARACPSCCAPSRRCASTSHAELVIVGAVPVPRSSRCCSTTAASRVLGRVDDAEKHARAARGRRALRAVARRRELRHGPDRGLRGRARRSSRRDIAGYRDVVRDGRDGMLVPRGDAIALAEALRDAGARRRSAAQRWATAAAERAQRYAWPQRRRARSSTSTSRRSTPRPRAAPPGGATAGRRAPALDRADGRPRRRRPRRLPTLEPAPAGGRARALRSVARRGALAVAALGGLGCSRIALQRIGVDRIVASAAALEPAVGARRARRSCAPRWSCARVAWHAILRAALPDGAVTRCATRSRAPSIGVLMSATLPARLGEPSRALIVARRARPRRARRCPSCSARSSRRRC